MTCVTYIKNLDDQKISIYRSLKGKGLGKNGLFIAEGDKVIQELLKSNLRVVSALMTEEWLKRFQRQLNEKAEQEKGIHVYIMAQKKMERVVGFNLHQGIMMAAESPPKLSLEQVSRFWNSPHLLLAINGIKDSENIGVIVRNSVAFGVDTIIVDKNSCVPYTRRAVRVSMGTIFRLPVAYTDCLSATLRLLKGRFNTRIIAAAPGTKYQILSKVDLSGNICLVFGSEEHGLSDDVIKSANSTVRIPMYAGLDSLNVSCASAIFLYHVRTKGGSLGNKDHSQ